MSLCCTAGFIEMIMKSTAATEKVFSEAERWEGTENECHLHRIKTVRTVSANPPLEMQMPDEKYFNLLECSH